MISEMDRRALGLKVGYSSVKLWYSKAVRSDRPQPPARSRNHRRRPTQESPRCDTAAEERSSIFPPGSSGPNAGQRCIYPGVGPGGRRDFNCDATLSDSDRQRLISRNHLATPARQRQTVDVLGKSPVDTCPHHDSLDLQVIDRQLHLGQWIEAKAHMMPSALGWTARLSARPLFAARPRIFTPVT